MKLAKPIQLMKRWMALTAIAPIALYASGCQNGVRWDLSRQWFRPKGEAWTILCAEFQGPARRQQAEAIARELKQMEGIRARQVLVRHEDMRSQVLYGTYYRQIDPQSRRLTIPDSLRQDLKRIQQSGTARGESFAAARTISSPSSNVGNPAWQLDRADGAHTLLVAIFQNTPDYYDRRAAAAAYAKDLRRRGYEAYYHHGRISSEVTIGSFGPDALVEAEHVDPRLGAYVVMDHSAEVKALQCKEKTFPFLLLNGRKQAIKLSNGADGRYVASRLVPIRLEDDRGLPRDDER